MDMIKFMSDQDPDYYNVLSELRRLIEPVPHQVKEALGLASSRVSETGGKFDEETYHQGQSARDDHQSTVHGDSTSTQPKSSVNTVSSTFNSGGGKIIQGNQFHSGGPMSF